MITNGTVIFFYSKDNSCSQGARVLLRETDFYMTYKIKIYFVLKQRCEIRW